MTEQEFFSKIPQWLDTDIEEWSHITLLGYFCWKYKKKHGVDFRLVRSKKGVELSKESADFAKLFRTLAPENYTDLPKEQKKQVRREINLKIKNYINWCFDYKYRYGDKSINGTRLFLVTSMINEFERMYNKYLEKKKNDDLFSIYLNWCKENTKEVFNIIELNSKEDIKYLKRYIEQYEYKGHEPEIIALNKAKELGLV